MLMLHLYYPEEVLEAGVPAPEVGVKLLSEAEQRCRDDSSLMIQIINNRLYYFVETGQLHDRARLEEDYERLETLQREAEPDEAMWPPHVLDTLAWAQWVLFGAEARSERQRIIGRLERATQAPGITPTERHSRMRHLIEVLKADKEAGQSH